MLYEVITRSDDVVVLDRVIQQRQKINPKFILGKGKLAEIMLSALRSNALLAVATIDRDIAAALHGQTEEGDAEELFLGQPAELNRQAGKEGEDIEVAAVVRHADSYNFV